ncbi:MAG: hypothetical protein V3V00_07170, partial [Saprospiraceae bacterium]
MPRKWLSIALLNFFLAGCLGVLMRFAFVSEVSWMDYRYIMHAHSHMAMLGWLYLSLFILLVSYFLDAHQQSKSIYKRLFALTQIAVIGMFLSFPFQGYGLYSITFSTLHILLSYAFAYRFIKDLGSNGDHHFASLLFVKSALGLMIISTFALFAMAPVMASEMKQSAWYYGLVQFFLHFQFNGWYIFGILSLSFRLLEYWNIIIPKRKVIIFYSLLLFSCLFTFALAVTWSTPVSGLFWINSLGVSLQFLALVYLFRMLKPYYSSIRRKLQGWILALFSIAVLSFIMKIVVQSAVVIPYIATVAYTIRLYVIGFIHLILLACITAAVFAFAS